MRCRNCGGWKYRRNAEDIIRKLERLAAAGDFDAQERLRRIRRRSQKTVTGHKVAFKIYDRMDQLGRIEKVVNLERGFTHPIDVPTLWDEGRVWWSKDYNTYVLVKPPEGEQGQFWHEIDGHVNLYSVNGAGEIRWMVTVQDAEDPYDEGYFAAKAFGLVD